MKLDLEYFRDTLATNAKLLTVALAFFIPLSNTVTTILSLVVAVFCILSIDKAKALATIKHPVTISICFLLFIYALATTYTAADAQAISQAMRKIGRLVYIPLLCSIFGAAFWRRNVMLGFALAVLVSVVCSIYAGHLVFKDNIFTSLFVAYTVFVLAHYARSYPRWLWPIIAVIAVLLYYLLFVCIGRTGQILFFILYAVFCVQVFAHNLRALLVSGLVFAALLAAVSFLPSTFMARQVTAAHEVHNYLHANNASVLQSSMGIRLTFAENAWELIKQKPFLGWGTGAFAQAYAQHFPESKTNGTFTVNPHNQYLLIWVEVGIVGLAALLYIFLCMGREFWLEKTLDGYLGFGLVVAIALGCLVNSWLLDYTSMFFFVVLSGVLLGSCQRRNISN